MQKKKLKQLVCKNRFQIFNGAYDELECSIGYYQISDLTSILNTEAEDYEDIYCTRISGSIDILEAWDNNQATETELFKSLKKAYYSIWLVASRKTISYNTSNNPYDAASWGTDGESSIIESLFGRNAKIKRIVDRKSLKDLMVYTGTLDPDGGYLRSGNIGFNFNIPKGSFDIRDNEIDTGEDLEEYPQFDLVLRIFVPPGTIQNNDTIRGMAAYGGEITLDVEKVDISEENMFV